jgi:beta-hydroxyacyl-ACP dehydratase FabZ
MATINIDEIMKILPHRYPFLMVDRIVECDNQKRIVGIKNVSANEPYFQGHFPGMPVMPGVLQLESMAQTAGILMNALGGESGGIPYFMGIDNARFRKVIKPGDQMVIEVEMVTLRSRVARFKAKVMVDGALASEAEMLCMLTEQKADAR